MSTARRFSIFFLIIVSLVLGGLLFLSYFAKAITTPASRGNGEIEFVVKKGDGVRQVSARLYDQGLIKNAWDFEVYVWLRQWGSRLQAGKYSIPQDVTIREVAQILAAGKDASPEHSLTIIEGWTLADIAAYLESQGVVRADFFLEAADRLKGQNIIEPLADKPATASLEGYLFPDTYRVFDGASSEEIIRKMLYNFDDKLTEELRKEISDRKISVFDAVTMASILEKEGRKAEDFSLISDIFWRRLKAGQRLESDATLNYILKSKNDRLSAVELKNPSPYNSYRYDGLPPGPISNPSFNALEAAVRPKPNDYWYFLTTSGGEVKYAKTYQEHLANKRQYLK